MGNDRPQTQADEIIDTFLTSLSKENGLEEVSSRLRKTILEDKNISQENIEKALFDKV